MTGEAFDRRVAFDDVNSLVAVLTQSTVQDNIWAAYEAAEIFVTKFPAYLVPQNENDASPSSYYAILPLEEEFRDCYAEVWKRFTDDNARIGLAFHKDGKQLDVPDISDRVDFDWRPLASGIWQAKIMEFPAGIPALKDHPVEEMDIVLHVHMTAPKKDDDGPGLKTFSTRAEANAALAKDPTSWNQVSLFFDPMLEDARRKVNAVCGLLEGADPLNSGRDDPECDAPELRFKMALHRDLWVGAGFYNSLRGDMVAELDKAFAAISVGEEASIPVDDGPRSLPIVDMLDLPSIEYLQALLLHISKVDRERFTKYMSSRPLGLAIFTAVSYSLAPLILAGTDCFNSLRDSARQQHWPWR